MGIFAKKQESQVPSRNIGVAIVDGKLCFCIIKYSKNTQDIERACLIGQRQEIEPSKVTPLNKMFDRVSIPDKEEHGHMIADVEKVSCEAWESLLSDKTFLMLLKLSI